jgi:3-oxoacyl-[acyl-carrier protein] reductase
MQYAARMMMPRRNGSIVNVASIIGRTGNEGQVVYGASKAAVIGATKSAARELAPHNVRVNAVAPGVIQTDMIANIPLPKMEELRHSIKMGRLGTAEEVARVILFLASDLSVYVTGQVIGVDGGMWL